MAVDSDLVFVRRDNVQAGVAIDVPIQTYDLKDVVVMFNGGFTAERGVDYTATLYNDLGFSVTLSASFVARLGDNKVVYPGRLLGMLSDFREDDSFVRRRIAQEFDRTIMRFQQTELALESTLRVPIVEGEISPLPLREFRAGKVLGFNVSGNPQMVELLTDGNDYQLRSEKGRPRGYAPLDNAGKIPLEYTTPELLQAIDRAEESAGVAAQTVTALRQAVGEPGGIAELDNTGKVPASQLPAAQAADVKAPRNYAKSEVVNPAKLFERPDAPAGVRAGEVVDAKLPFNNIDNRQIVGSAVRVEAEGSIKNGPGPASVALTVSAYKENFGKGSAKGGELDCIYVVGRQDSPRDGSLDINSPTRGDGCGILIDYAGYENVGFLGGIEGATTILRNDGQGQSKRQGYQIGVTDSTTGSSMGFFTGATLGQHSTGVHVHADEAGGGYYSSPFYYGTERGKIFSVERDGTVSLGKRLANGDLLQNAMHLVIQADYSFGIANADKSAQLLNLDQSGKLNVLGGVYAPNLPTVEKGTWSPTLRGSGGSPLGSYSAYGTWTKVGPLVTFAITWSISSVGSASGQHLQVTDMPFARSENFDAGIGRLLGPTGEDGFMVTGYGGTANPRLLTISRYDAAMLAKSGGSGRVGGTYVAQ